jgi:hypothetical protein
MEPVCGHGIQWLLKSSVSQVRRSCITPRGLSSMSSTEAEFAVCVQGGNNKRYIFSILNERGIV